MWVPWPDAPWGPRDTAENTAACALLWQSLHSTEKIDTNQHVITMEARPQGKAWAQRVNQMAAEGEPVWGQQPELSALLKCL